MNRNKRNKNVKVNKAIENMEFTNSIDNLKAADNKNFSNENQNFTSGTNK